MAEAVVNDIAVGIDLGTTNSCVAFVRNDQVHVITNGEGARLTPSTVCYEKGEEPQVGVDASKLSNSGTVVFGTKRLIGRWSDHRSVVNAIESWPYKIVPDKADRPQIIVEEGEDEIKLYPEDISAKILCHLKILAEDYLGQPVTRAVVTVPAQFDDNQRYATKAACEKAGLEVISIINEPTAAAIAYAIDKLTTNDEQKRTVVVYDVGGGTLDVTVLQSHNGTFQVLATGGNSHLAGEDFTQNLFNHLATLFRQSHGIKIYGNRTAVKKLRKACEETKVALSTRNSKTVQIDNLFNGKDFKVEVTRKTFEEINEEAFRTTITYVEDALKTANVGKSDVDDIVLVGGSTRIPRLQELLREFFDGKSLKKSINPDEAVAMGAAILGASLTNSLQSFTLIVRDILPVSMGIDIEDGCMNVIVEGSTEIPTSKSSCYTTSKGDQTRIIIPVYQGMRPLVKNNTFLGSFVLDGIEPGPPGVPQVVVKFDYDASGMLQVSAYNKKHPSLIKKIVIKRERVMDGDHVNLINDYTLNKESDKEKKEILLSRNRLRKLCAQIEYFIRSKEMGANIKADTKNTLLKLIEKSLTMCLRWESIGKVYFDNQINILEEAVKDTKDKYRHIYDKFFAKPTELPEQLHNIV